MCARVLHESFLVPALMHGNEAMICEEKEGSRIRTIQMDNLRGLVGISRTDKVSNVQIREFYGVTKGERKG